MAHPVGRIALGSVARTVVSSNQILSRHASRWIAHAGDDSDIEARYVAAVATHMNRLQQGLVIDVGSGRSCRFAHMRQRPDRVRIVGVDVSHEELRDNVDVDEKRVADVTAALPFTAAEADLVVSRSVVEHLPDVEGYVVNAAHALKPGGYFINLFPSKFAPFALVNQALPPRLASRVVRLCFPGSDGVLGFPAYYDNCSHTRFARLLRRHGFDVVACHVSYHQAFYFAAFFPAYLANAFYESVARGIGAKNLAARLLFVARRR